MRQPIIQRNRKDRTGVGRLIKRAYAAIDARFAELQLDVMGLFGQVPAYQLNAAEYSYGMTPEQQLAFTLAMSSSIDSRLELSRPPEEYWYGDYDRAAVETGTVQTNLNLSHLSELHAAARPIELVVASQPYRDRVAAAQLRSYQHWRSLGAKAQADLSQVIMDGIGQGKSPKAIVTDISNTINVNRSRAKLYAQTDLTNTLRETKMAEVEEVRRTLGLDVQLLWTSAFLTTTRTWHAARHGKVYTTEQVQTFYAAGGNRYNCHCAVTEVIVEDGKPLLTDRVQGMMDKELEVWQADRGV